MLVHKRPFVVAYWIVAVLLVAVAGAVGARWGDDEAPTFTDENSGSVPANGVSHLLYQVFGGVLAALAALAVFAGVWLLLWARARKSEAVYDDVDDDEDTMSVDDVEHLLDEEGGDEGAEAAADGDGADDEAADDDATPRSR